MSNIIRGTKRASEPVVVADRESAGGRVTTQSTLAAEARASAARIVAAARSDADALAREAREQVNAIRLEAYDDGFRQGRQEGLAVVEERFARAIELLHIAANDAVHLRERLLRTTERDAIELVLDIARQILGEAAAQDPALAVELAERALARAGNQNVLRIRVHPERHEIVAAAFVDRNDSTGSPISVVADERIDLGGCLIDLRAGTVDARLGTQMDEIARVLRAQLGDDDEDGNALDD